MKKPLKYNIAYFKQAKANKSNWIRAIEFVIEEYENGCHTRNITHCAFCQLATSDIIECASCITSKCMSMGTHKHSIELRLIFWKKSIHYIRSVKANKFKSYAGILSINKRLHEIDTNVYEQNRY